MERDIAQANPTVRRKLVKRGGTNPLLGRSAQLFEPADPLASRTQAGPGSHLGSADPDH